MKIDKQILGWGTGSLILGIIMAVLNLHDSWSKYADLADSYLFTPGLVSIIITFILVANKHPQKDRKLYNLFKRWNVKLKHQAYLTALLFLGVITFSINNPKELIQILHLVFTGSAMLSAYLILIFYPKTRNKRILYTQMAITGILSFFLGFGLNLYTTAWAEVALSVPIFLFLLFTARE